MGKQNGGKALSAKDITLGDPFVYNHLGSMASVGRYKALVDLRQSKVTQDWHKFHFILHNAMLQTEFLPYKPSSFSSAKNFF